MKDRVIRAVTQDGSFRVITVQTTELVREALKIHFPEPHLSAERAKDRQAFAELMTGVVLMRETMAPSFRLQMVVSRQKLGQMVVDAYPEPEEGGGSALTRGVYNVTSPLAVFDKSATLTVMRSLPRGKLHQSMVEVQPEGICPTLMHYLQTSEQIYAMLGLSVVFEGNEVKAAGGYLVQLLPEVSDQILAVMTERLDFDFKDLGAFLVKHNADAEVLKNEILYMMPHETLYSGTAHYGCTCSEERVLGAVATLGKEEVEDIVQKGEVISMTCEYCRTAYSIGPDRLKGLLVQN